MIRDPAPAPLSGAFRAVWRWHFYAGLLVLPFLMLMALTGALYLFTDEIDGAVYRDLSRIEPRAGSAAPDLWVAAAETGLGGKVANVLVPARPDEAVRLTVNLPDGDKRTAFVDPYDARLIGSTSFGGVMETVKQLHSLILLGRWANYVVEIVAGWAIILVATGLFLWWPRGRGVGVVSVRAIDPKRRPFWRDVHAVTGLYAGAVIAFLVITGMPWSAFWGDQPRIDPASGSAYDVVYARYSDGTNASPYVRVRVLSYGADFYKEGIPDSWRLSYFGSTNPATGLKHRAADDADGDGYSNLQEFLLGSNPTNKNSNLRITSITPATIQWQAKGYEVYELCYSTNFTNWARAASPIMPTNSIGATTFFTNGGPRQFFRVYRVP